MISRLFAGIAVLAAVAGSAVVAAPAQALQPVCPITTEGTDCGGGDGGGGGGGGGTTPSYTLQGVIQTEGFESSGQGRRVKIRGYSRLANSSNNRVDADYINVRCFAYDALGGYTTDYDSENGGALVDVHFASNFVYGIGSYRTITVNCTHEATKYGVTYNATSTLQVNIPE